MRKILVMIPAGEVYDHDCTRWYHWDDRQRTIAHYHNIGDSFVFDSSLKLLDFDQVQAINIREMNDKLIDRANEEFAYCFLRGSNYLHGAIDWRHTLEVVERLKIPVIAFGIGAQAPARGALVLSDQTKAVVRAMAERCTTMGVRGAYTADVLWGLGIRNVRVIGCPTLFRNRDPDLAIRLPPLDEIRRVAFTLRREVGGDYAQDVGRYLARQRAAILALAGRFDLTVMTQGEVEEKAVLLGEPEQREAALATLAKQGWLGDESDPLRRIYAERLFYSDVTKDYDEIVRRQQLVLGYRLHGNLMALANGVPSVYFTYDSRTAEFVETFRIPSFDVFAGEEFALERFWDQALFDRFNRAYHAGWREMRAFLEENGMPHRMGAAPAAGAVRRAA
jgi:hypothetical protein